jgi:hypothetical protein
MKLRLAVVVSLALATILGAWWVSPANGFAASALLGVGTGALTMPLSLLMASPVNKKKLPKIFYL